MPKIETQGLSEDYQTATGEYDPIDRGDLNKPEILEILSKVVHLKTPEEPNSCPPSVNAVLSGDIYTCFYGDSGVIRCSDSKEEKMSPDTAAQIICKELTIEEYDLSKGHQSSSSARLMFIVACVMAVLLVGAYVYST